MREINLTSPSHELAQGLDAIYKGLRFHEYSALLYQPYFKELRLSHCPKEIKAHRLEDYIKIPLSASIFGFLELASLATQLINSPSEEIASSMIGRIKVMLIAELEKHREE